MAVLNLLWFAAVLRTTLADAGQDGWGAAATASRAVLGGMFLLLIAAYEAQPRTSETANQPHPVE